jgi:hypothetical protein
MELSEVKDLIGARLRDPKTDPKVFRDLVVILARLEGWNRKSDESDPTAELDDIDAMVRKLEKEQRVPSVANVVSMHEEKIAGDEPSHQSISGYKNYSTGEAS